MLGLRQRRTATASASQGYERNHRIPSPAGDGRGSFTSFQQEHGHENAADKRPYEILIL
jgi:hypothetical protein